MWTGDLIAPGGYAPNGCLINAGLDGGSYIVQAQRPDPSNVNIGSIGLNSTHPVVDITRWRDDLDATVLTPAGVGPKTGFSPSVVIPGYRSSLFWVVGFSYIGDNSAGLYLACGVRYQIVNNTTVAVDGGGLWRVTDTFSIPDFSDLTFGAAIIGGKFYACTAMAATHNEDHHDYLVQLDSSGVDINLAAGAWDSHITQTPFELQWLLTNSGRVYTNCNSLEDAGGGLIGIYLYIGVAEIAAWTTPPMPYAAPTLLYVTINPATHAVVGPTDVSASFGVPWADAGKNFAGAAGTARDDYTSPSITDGEIIFGRSFSDQNKMIRIRRFKKVAGVPTAVSTHDFQGTPDVFAGTMDQIELYKSGSVINSGMTDNAIWRLGGLSLASGSRRIVTEAGPIRSVS